MTDAIVHRYAGRKRDALLHFLLFFEANAGLIQNKLIAELANVQHVCADDALLDHLLEHTWIERKAD